MQLEVTMDMCEGCEGCASETSGAFEEAIQVKLLQAGCWVLRRRQSAKLQCLNSSSSCLEFGFQFGRAVVIACVGGDGVAQSRKQAGVYESTQVLMAMRLFTKGFADQTMQWGCGLKREGFVKDICLYH